MVSNSLTAHTLPPRPRAMLQDHRSSLERTIEKLRGTAFAVPFTRWYVPVSKIKIDFSPANGLVGSHSLDLIHDFPLTAFSETSTKPSLISPMTIHAGNSMASLPVPLLPDTGGGGGALNPSRRSEKRQATRMGSFLAQNGACTPPENLRSGFFSPDFGFSLDRWPNLEGRDLM